MELAIAQALRASGCVAPNPLVGAVIERDGTVLATGFHAFAGALHAEAAALEACDDARGATLYVTLEPCRHYGKQPPCVDTIVRRGIARVVVGTMDPNPVTNGRGVAELRAAGVEVDVVDSAACARLIEGFTVWTTTTRPYIALKMAASLDGCVTDRAGTRRQLTGDAWQAVVRELRIAHDGVLVGAGTVRVDDPLLTVRPPAQRARKFVRIVACETDTVPETSRVFAPVDGYVRTIVLAPAGLQDRFTNLANVADLAFVGGSDDRTLDLRAAVTDLRARGIYSAVCEGGPTLAAGLIAEGLVDRVHWAIAPLLLRTDDSVPALVGRNLGAMSLHVAFDRSEAVGDDVYVSGKIVHV